MTTTKRTELVNTAKEMIDVMELEEENGEAPIPTDKKTKAKTIERKILEAVEYIEEDDKFSSETIATLKALGVEIEVEEEEKKELDFDEEAQEPEKDVEDEEPETEMETEVDEKEDSVNKGKVVYTKNAIKKMDKKKLESVAKGISIDLDDYRGKLKDLRQAVMDKMGFGNVEEPEEKEEPANEPTAKMSYSFPFLEIKATKKLQDLKDITMSDDRFKKLREGLEEFKGLEGARVLKEKMLSCFKQSEAPKKAETKKETGKGRGKSAKFSPDQTIEILVDKNPKRKGAACYDRFDLYENSMTVKEYLNAGGIRADLPWDVAREFIVVK